ncbi:MAG TPA: hypothetical protein PKH10_00420 [bacterium]|nr:hypothetical protein [bacterium]
MTEPSVSQSFLATIEKNASSLVSLGEPVLDNVLSKGYLRDIPLLGTLVSLGKIGDDIRGYYFVKKIWHFLKETKNISQEDRDRYIAEMELDEKKFDKACEQLLLIIEKLDAMEKAQIIGRLFKARVEKRITEDQFLVASQITDRMMHGDLVLLQQYEKIPDQKRQHLLGLRLLDLDKLRVRTAVAGSSVRQMFSLSEYGKILLAETKGL